jgi:hypothetical protein
MVAIIESNTPGEGNRYAAVANWVAAVLIAIPIVLLARGLFGTIGSGHFENSIKAISWVIGILATLMGLHLVAAYGSRLRRAWARKLSRTLATILLPIFPFGTVIGVLIFRYTSPGRWISE